MRNAPDQLLSAAKYRTAAWPAHIDRGLAFWFEQSATISVLTTVTHPEDF